MAAQREWYEKDYYKVLGVSDTATAKEITKAYRKLARDSHPDTHPGDAMAEERFKDVSAAYDVLGDEAKRKEYDEVRRLGPGAFGPMGGGRPGRRAELQRRRRRPRRPARPDVRPRPPRRRRVGRRRAAARRRCRGHADARLRRRGHRASPPRCTSPPTRSAAPATARAPSPARSRRCARAAAVAASSTTTRASSRSRRRATCAVVAASSSRTRAPPATASGVEQSPARGAGAHPGRRRRRPEDPAEGSRRARVATAGRPATCIVECHVVAAPHVRPRRQQPHRARAGHLRRARPRRQHRGAHARRQHGHAAAASPARSRARATASRARASSRRRATAI